MLNRIELREDVFNQILVDYESRIKLVSKEDFEKLSNIGYNDNKKTIVYNGTNMFICQSYVLTSRVGYINESWKQIVCNKSVSVKKEWSKGVRGNDAYNEMKKVLVGGRISEQEWFRILRDGDDHQTAHPFIKWPYFESREVIVKFSNVKYYDINSAYPSELCKYFPLSAADLEKMYEERKIKPENKKIFNYFVGMLAHKGYWGLWNKIISGTREKLEKGMDATDGYIIYANTDGFMVQNGKNIECGNKLGQWKLSYEGDIYVYFSNHGVTIQYGNEFTGKMPLELRKYCDFSKGKVVQYDKEFNSELNIYKIKNAKNVTVEVINE